MIGTDWVLDGRRVRAEYLGTEITGTVTDSRVKYGGRIGYTVQLDVPVLLKFRSEPTDRVLIENHNLLEIFPESAA